MNKRKTLSSSVASVSIVSNDTRDFDTEDQDYRNVKAKMFIFDSQPERVSRTVKLWKPRHSDFWKLVAVIDDCVLPKHIANIDPSNNFSCGCCWRFCLLFDKKSDPNQKGYFSMYFLYSHIFFFF